MNTTLVRVLLALPVVAFAALAALFYLRLYAGDPGVLPSALVDRPAPAFTLAALDAPQGPAVPGFSTGDLSDGSVTVVNFWASWCAPCRIEHPYLMALSERDDIRLFGVAYKDKPEDAARFLDQLGNPFARIGMDLDGRVAIDWGVYGAPETYVVDGNGVIVARLVGVLNDETMATIIEPAIARAKAASR